MAGSSTFSSGALVSAALLSVQHGVSFLFFLFLDLADSALCVLFSLVDSATGDHWGPCYCYSSSHSSLVPDPRHKQRKSWLGPADRSSTDQGALIVAVDGREHGDPCFQHSPLTAARKRTLRLGETCTLTLPLSQSLTSLSELLPAAPSAPTLTSPLSKSEPALKSLDQSTDTAPELRRIVSSSRISGRKWTDCWCAECADEGEAEQPRLHVQVLEPTSQQAESLSDEGLRDGAAGPAADDEQPTSTGDVLFLHGFCSSSSFWADTAIPHLSPGFRRKHRLLLVDLMGFGRSPKPGDSLYTVGEHAE